MMHKRSVSEERCSHVGKLYIRTVAARLGGSFVAACMVLVLFCAHGFAAVDLYLAPTRSTQIVGDRVTYDMYLQADVDTRIEALGDVFLAYDRSCLRIVTGDVVDRATQISWTDRILDVAYTGPLYGVTGNTGVLRFAKISLREKMQVSANVPVLVLSVPFEIITTPSFTVTRLYFPRAMVIDDMHKNVLRNAADSFLIRDVGSQRSTVQKRKK